jgi:hypothetical protein
MPSELRKAIKDISATVALVVGIGLLLEGAFAPGNFWFLVAFAATGVTWANMFLNDRNKKRADAVRKAFGVSEPELTGGAFGLSSEQITQLLDDPKVRAEYIAGISAGMAPHYRRVLEEDDPYFTPEDKALFRKLLSQ